MKFIPLTETYYAAFYALVQSTQWGNPMLPVAYNNSLWGMLVQDPSGAIVGGWVGTLRGNAPLVRCIAKSVYFDSYPIFCSLEDEAQYLPRLMEAVKQYARRQHIVMLNLTHWVRGCELPIDIFSKEATFCIPLHDSTEQLWKLVESKQRNCIRKGEKNGVEVDICQESKTITYTSPQTDWAMLQLQAAAECGRLLWMPEYAGYQLVIKADFAAEKCAQLSLDILQAAGLIRYKTEYVSCPSCGRTLFKIEEVIREIREATGHLKGLKIAVMGCIVNGPGEMADADYGYVGAARGKISLYRQKECVRMNIPQENAVQELVNLIRQDGKWEEK